MLDRIIRYSVSHKLIIALVTLSIAGFGVFALFNIPLGAVPDITNNQVQVITTSTKLSTQDVEQFITYPVELEMSNLPGVQEIRSISKFGLSVVTIVFDDNMGTYLPRQLIAEKIKIAAENIPEGFGTPEMGPITTGLGEIYQYILDTRPGYEDKYSIMELRTIQDWIVKRQLSGIPGVVEVNTWGGYLKQYEVAVNPERIRSMKIDLTDIFTAIENNNSVAGGAYIEKENQSYFIRGDGLVKTLEDIEEIVVSNRNGIPVLVRDLAEVRFGSANRFGAITANGEGEKVMGQIMMLKDANSNKVIEAVKERVAEVQHSLPEGIYINPIVERSELIGKTSFTVFENLLLGCLIVFFIVVLLLGNIRSGLVIASIIPLALLFTISMMYIFGIDANLMSLGALDFGIIIDGAVIIVEFIAIKLTMSRDELDQVSGDERQSLMDRITFNGASRMMNSAIFGQVIILIVFIPVLSLSGVEGKMFRPMALSFSFALLGAMFFGLTWLPVASSLFLRPEPRKQFAVTRWIMQVIYRSYDPVIRWSYAHKRIILGLALIALLATGIVFSRMGGEFVPTLDEGDFVIQPVLPTGTSLSKTVELTTRMEQILIENFPEVDQIVCRIGAAEVPTDPMSMEEIDMIIKLNPKRSWTSAETKEELANRFKEALQVIPGIEYEFTQPIEMRFNELITGVRADLAIKIFGEDLGILAAKSEEVRNLISGVEGAADIIVEKTEGLPQMSVTYNREKIAYYGLNIEEVNRYLTMAFGGETAGSIFEGERQFDLAVRLLPKYRNDIDHIRNLTFPVSGGIEVPFHELAEIRYSSGPAKISRDDTRRRVVVSVNVRNRDLESVVNDIESILDRQLELPSGYFIDYGGQFENLRNASRRLRLAVPVALLLIFIFLHFAFRSFKEAALVFTAVPLSAVGGVFLLWIRGMPFSISAGIGFIALFGVAVLNGIVLIEHLKDLKEQGITDMRERVLKGTRERLRPVLLTASAAAMGFLPMAVSTSAGAEVQRPLATVVIGGLVTSTMLTMLALPLLYAIFDDVSGIRIWPPGLKRTKVLVLLPLLLVPVPSLSQYSPEEHKPVQELSLDEALEKAYANNSKLAAYRALADEADALIRTAYAIDRTSVYYSYDENNIAANDYPIGVIGAEQRFDFPTLYTARKKTSILKHSMAEERYLKERQVLGSKITGLYTEVVYHKNRLIVFSMLDSVYGRYSASAEAALAVGEISRLDMLNAKSRQSEVRQQCLQIQTEAGIAMAKLIGVMNYDSLFSVPGRNLEKVEFLPPDIDKDPGYKYLNRAVEMHNSRIREKKNEFLPDITVGLFDGTNNWPGAEHYSGFEVGLGIPLFFGEQRAEVKAAVHSRDAIAYFREDYKQAYATRVATLMAELDRYERALQYYNDFGKSLSAELLRVAHRSLESGETDFFRFSETVDRAVRIELDHLDYLQNYNRVAIELNYLTME